MNKSKQALVIVESPAKARTISKYLGDGYEVLSSKGHIRDLAKGKLSLDPEAGWKANFTVDKDREKDVAILRKAARNADCLYLATDRDREGEAIAWHLSELMKGLGGEHIRVVFNEVTESAIQESFAKRGSIDIDLVHAQQARRYLDRVVGFDLSPLLWKKIARGLSAGRVQSVALRLLVEREREIRAFVPEEYWTLDAEVGVKGYPLQWFAAQRYGDKPLKIGHEGAAKEHNDRLTALLSAGDLKLSEVSSRESSLKPRPPYITSTLQREANSHLGMSVAQTMRVAQSLYEAGHITYMRTDAVNLSAEAVAAARDYIGANFRAPYLPSQAPRYASGKRAQESHEAIRPTRIGDLEKMLRGIRDRSEQRLYALIWNRFMASQMTPCRIVNLSVQVTAGDYLLQASGRSLVFDGFTRLTPWVQGAMQSMPGFEELAKGREKQKKASDAEAVNLNGGETRSEQHFTRPPGRYSEASFVRELEKHGIGRPSTYQNIIATLLKRGYVEMVKKSFHVQPLGEVVSNRLIGSFPDLMDVHFTAGMEDQLDEIAAGRLNWKQLLDQFYAPFRETLKQASAPESEGGMRDKQITSTEIPCSLCERKMLLRMSGGGIFLSCPGYSDKENPCKGTRPLTEILAQKEAVDSEGNGEDVTEEEPGGSAEELRRPCPKCDSPALALHVDKTYRIYLCVRYPDCDGNLTERGNYSLGGETDGIPCERCGANMEFLNGRFGPYFSCTGCDNKRRATADGKPEPPRMRPIPLPDIACAKYPDDHYVLREGRSGLFLAASKYPKNRETRAPQVRELAAIADDQLEDKFRYLARAPQADPDGNATEVRFDRIKQEHWLGSVTGDGTRTRWGARHNPATQGGWDEVEVKAAARRTGARSAKGKTAVRRTASKPKRASASRTRS